MKKQLKKMLFGLKSAIFDKKDAPNELIIITNGSNEEDEKFREVSSRVKFFEPGLQVTQSVGLSNKNKLNNKLVAYLSYKPSKLLTKLKDGALFNLDYQTNYEDGWEYHRILNKINQDEIKNNRPVIKNKLSAIRETLKKDFDKAYILGTGPSLEKAYNRSWDDGIRIVSNTIVKDKDLWNHIKPHFIVAGDAIYHYGIADFAKAFRKDLAERLSETDTYFVFQEHFYPFVKKSFPQFIDRLIPIPVTDGKSVYNIIESKFELPGIGNVLNGLLLPLSCYLSDHIYLWGFDGRSPNDKLFWKNSDKHFYSDLVPQLQSLHPAFFDALVPKENPGQYVLSVHGDVLENLLKEGEKNGKVFKMMHPSYTETLKRRYDNTIV